MDILLTLGFSLAVAVLILVGLIRAGIVHDRKQRLGAAETGAVASIARRDDDR